MTDRNTRLLLIGSGRSYHATRWANALADAGIRVSFATIHRQERPLNDEVDFVQLPSWGRASFLLNARRLRSLIDRIKPDLVHSHSAGGYAIMGWLSAFRPRIVSVYGSDVYEAPTRSRFHKAYIGHVLGAADQVLATSEAMADHVRTLFPALRRPVVTPFGVDLGLFSPGPGRERDPNVTRIGIVKKLMPVYGIDVLIDAYAMLPRNEERPVELHIVGDGPEKGRLQERVKASGRSDDVVFHPAIPNAEVPAFLRTLDLFVVPSRSEGFGVAAVEAAGVGLATIVTNVGGLPEIVDHERTGLVVPSEDPTSLAKAIQRLVDDPQERARFGIAAREKAEAEYDWDQNVADMIEIYLRMLAKRETPGC